MSQEHDLELVRGLPGPLPAGERILWQGAPDWRVLARRALPTRWVALYFAVLGTWSVVSSTADGRDLSHAFTGTALTLLAGALGIGLIALFAWGVGRTSVYTITNKRIVLRIGVAVSKCVNLPFAQIAGAGLKLFPGGAGDIPVTLLPANRVAHAQLWPHVRPFRFAATEPMLRAVPEAAAVADLLGQALLAAHPQGHRTPAAVPAEGPGFAAPVAA